MAKRNLSEEEEAELATLHSRLMITLRFFEEVESFPSGLHFRSVIDRAAKRKDLRTLRLVQRDVQEMTLALSSQQRDTLEAQLHQELGIDSDVERSRATAEVAAILARGAIRSEKERQRLECYLDTLAATQYSDDSEVEAIRRLLAKT